MISNQILQNTIDGLKAITRTDLCVIDVEGKILVATFPDAEQLSGNEDQNEYKKIYGMHVP